MCRALLISADGRQCLTSGADRTLRLWDLAQQRCVQTLAVHTDSVWTLAASPDFSTVYSGGRDGCIYRGAEARVPLCHLGAARQ